MAIDPFLGPNPVMNILEARRGAIEQVRQNSSRLAQSFNSVETVGVGMIRLRSALIFDCSFIQKPIVGYGMTVESDLVEGDFPSCSGGVTDWRRNSRGFYLGAYVYLVVTAVEDPTIQHDFTFTGIAMKDLPEHLLDL